MCLRVVEACTVSALKHRSFRLPIAVALPVSLGSYLRTPDALRSVREPSEPFTLILVIDPPHGAAPRSWSNTSPPGFEPPVPAGVTWQGRLGMYIGSSRERTSPDPNPATHQALVPPRIRPRRSGPRGELSCRNFTRPLSAPPASCSALHKRGGLFLCASTMDTVVCIWLFVGNIECAKRFRKGRQWATRRIRSHAPPHGRCGR